METVEPSTRQANGDEENTLADPLQLMVSTVCPIFLLQALGEKGGCVFAGHF